jgi:hypothetical protein
MKMTPVAIAILTLPFCSALALAQGDPMAMMKQAAANQLGLLEYCQAQGAVDDKPVTTQREIMAQLPASAAPTDAAEALGKQGSLSINGQSMSLTSAAAAHNTTVDAMCKQIGGAVVQAAEMLKQQQAGGGMPAMPGAPPKP